MPTTGTSARRKKLFLIPVSEKIQVVPQMKGYDDVVKKCMASAILPTWFLIRILYTEKLAQSRNWIKWELVQFRIVSRSQLTR